MDILIFVAGLVLGLLAMRWAVRDVARAVGLPAGASNTTPAVAADDTGSPEPEAVADTSQATPATATAPDAAATPAAAPGSTRDRVFRLKRDIEAQDDSIQHPQDLLAIADFRTGVDLLAGPDTSAADILEYLGSSGYVLSCMAACALPRRDDVTPEAALSLQVQWGGYVLRFILDYLQTRQDAATLPLLLRHAREWWWDATPVRQRLREYFAWAADHAPGTAPVNLDDLDEDALKEHQEALPKFQLPLLAPWLEQVGAALARRRERRVLGAFGRVLTQPREQAYYAHPQASAQIAATLERLTGPGAASVLVSGEHGVGKSALVDEVCRELLAQDWLVFEASAAEVLAGQSYIGELEARVREMLGVLNRPRAVWRVPDFHDLLHKGAHSKDPRGILDLLLPAIERGELRVLGEVTPRALAQLLVARPVIRHHVEVLTLQPAPPAVVHDIAAQWARDASERLGRTVAEPRLLGEATRMAAQYFPEEHEPGRLLRLLEETLKAATAQEPHALPLDNDALLVAIAARSGLPLEVVDDRRSLDLATLRAFFRERVLGQDEALDTLVDRIALLKAGLVDAGRPIGVFLFAGPTGTGKTEMAKALGELLFGSAERLVRLDMSEYQTEDAAWRLLGDGGDHDTARSFTARIREQPFSVVLLDEFEKAHPRVWDLFLQVFDDARLSDRSGNAVDFRHSIIILTSNVGSTLSRSAGPGFTSTAGGYSRGTVEKALNETFRREFLNRLDRIVLFNPLDRALMREILHKELRRVLERRGLRNRAWAVEWEPSAVEFLLDRGFTPDLGARPLRRAIEHYLLAPLARTIVEHRAPQGDQFLFVRSAGDALQVEFIDPDQGASVPPSDAGPARIAPGTDLRDLVYTPRADAAAVALLADRVQQLADHLAAVEWTQAREEDFAAMARPDFWSTAARFEVLDRIERRDRIEAAAQAAQRLAQRLPREGGSEELVGRLASLLFLLDLAIAAVAAHRPQDALLEIGLPHAGSPPAGTAGREDPQVRLWWTQLLGMYLAWAERRQLRVEVLKQDPSQCRAWIAVSGFGALDLLQDEAGLHVLELEQDDAMLRRVSLLVRVAPDLPGQTRSSVPPAAGEELRVCRRYRPEPSPLVRDGVRGWRTGRIDRVLAGEFDVVPLAE